MGGGVHFFSSTTSAGDKAWRWRGSERDLETESRRGQKHWVREDSGSLEPLCPCPAPPACSLLWLFSSPFLCLLSSAQLPGHHKTAAPMGLE